MEPSIPASRCAPPEAPRRKSCDGFRGVVGFQEVWVVVRFFQTFLLPRVRKTVFEKNPQQPTTPINPPPSSGRGNSFFSEERTPGPENRAAAPRVSRWREKAGSRMICKLTEVDG